MLIKFAAVLYLGEACFNFAQDLLCKDLFSRDLKKC